MDGPCTNAARRQAIEAEATRLFLAARASDAKADWDAAYHWIEQDPAHGCAFAKVEAGWELAARLGDVAPERLEQKGVVPLSLVAVRRDAGTIAPRSLALTGIAAGLIGLVAWRLVKRTIPKRPA